jgi:hypothetical protein
MDRVPGVGRQAWTLWVAAGLVVIGGVAPFVFGGTSSRIDGVIVPFLIGAIVLAACAMLPNLGRSLVAILYFLAGLAIAYGLLSIFSVPVRLAVLGTCPTLPHLCTSGLPRPLTDGENTGLGVAAACGILAILIGFYGLVIVYRRPVVAPVAAPERKIPPVAPVAPPERKIPPVAPAPASAPPPVAAVAREEEPELPAHQEEELPELPPHESSSATT